jgi:hypothetical protein
VPILKKAQERKQSQEESNLAFRPIITTLMAGPRSFLAETQKHAANKNPQQG